MTRKKRVVIDRSNNLQKILTEKGMLQIELADRALDGNCQLVNRIIKGQKQGLSLAVAMKIAAVLQTPVEKIFSITNTELE